MFAALLRVRRRVAEGKLHPADVGIYFVEDHEEGSTVMPITVDQYGALDQWPDGVFLESYEEAKAIQRAARAARARAAH